MSSHPPDEALRNLKKEPPARLRAEARAAMVRLSEQQFSKEKKRIAERRQRLDPVYTELEAVLRKSPEFAGVARAIDAQDKKHRPTEAPPASKHPFAPTRPLVRHGSIHLVDSLPFSQHDTWLGQEGNSNHLFGPPAADPTTGDMGFALQPGLHSSGQMSCWAAVGAIVAIPFFPILINFTASPSVSWWYEEDSAWWRQAAGNMWAGLYVGVYDAEGSFLEAAVDTQNSVASFNDYNFQDGHEDSGSNSAMSLFAGIGLGEVAGPGGPEAPGFLGYWCWIGGNANCDGTNGQSGAAISMNANCANLIVDMFEY